jgi:hypothetical protein
MNSSDDNDEFGNKSCGCQHSSTGFASGRIFCDTQLSNDLKISFFSGDNDCVFWAFRSALDGDFKWLFVGVHPFGALNWVHIAIIIV